VRVVPGSEAAHSGVTYSGDRGVRIGVRRIFDRRQNACEPTKSLSLDLHHERDQPPIRGAPPLLVMHSQRGGMGRVRTPARAQLPLLCFR
jgi:hypothetical protein